ncbi:hypothetical protein [Marinobacter salicampi]|uniref:hypothetical protein n=1 Tax=Marinobacter salicampi TaxID=435907 RepID=UPI00140CFE4D|nr:hypothetical protein [Marinobacter salicampi]
MPKLSQKNLTIHTPVIEIEGREALVKFKIESDCFSDTLYFRLDRAFASYVDMSLNCALVALLIPAMRGGLSIKLSGPVSYNLLTSCTLRVIPIIVEILGLEPVAIIHDGQVLKEGSVSGLSATGFSGGVDSYSILDDYYFNESQDRRGIDLLIFNNVGANGTIEEKELFHSRKNQALDSASVIGLPLIVVDSNLDEFYSRFEDLNFFKTHSFRNAAVAHLLSKGVSTYRYAAARSYKDVKVEPFSTIGGVDPITLPLLNSEGLDIQSEGAQYTRSQKIRRLIENPVFQENLYVCVDHNTKGNCSKCQKCVRTLLVIDLMGHLSKFNRSFSIVEYKKVKDKYLFKYLTSNDSFSTDIASLAKASDVQISKSLRVKIAIFKVVNGLKQQAKILLGRGGRRHL